MGHVVVWLFSQIIRIAGARQAASILLADYTEHQTQDQVLIVNRTNGRQALVSDPSWNQGLHRVGRLQSSGVSRGDQPECPLTFHKSSNSHLVLHTIALPSGLTCDLLLLCD